MNFLTKRCIIRPFIESDLDDFIFYRNNLEWMRYQNFKGLKKEDYIDLLIPAKSLEEGVQLAIVLKETNRVIGDLYIKKEDETYWIGYTVTPIKARQGYAYEVVSALIKELRLMGAKVVKAEVMRKNVASIALLHKLNFKLLESNKDELIFAVSFKISLNF